MLYKLTRRGTAPCYGRAYKSSTADMSPLAGPLLRRMESGLLAFEAALDFSMAHGAPLYVAVAVVLILAVALIFFAAVLPWVRYCRA